MNKTHSGKFNLLMNYIMLASNFLFPLITFPYVTRVLGAESLGRVSFAMSISNYFAALATFGINTYAVRSCARKKENPQELSGISSELFSLHAYTTGISVILFLAIIYFVPILHVHWKYLLVFCLSVALEFLGVNWYYTATEQFLYITIRGIAFKVLSLVGLFLFVHNPSDALIYACITVASTVIMNLFNYVFACRKTPIRLTINKGVWSHLKYTKWFFFQSIALTLLSNMDVSMIGVLSTETHVGYYEVALKFKVLSSALVSALGTVFLPRLSRAYEQKDMKEFLHVVYKSIRYNCVISFAAVGFCLISAESIIVLFCGDSYEFSINILRFIMLAVVFIGISTVTGIQVLISINEEKGVFLSYVTASFTNFILNILLIPRIHGVGAAIATVCAECMVMVVQLLWLSKKNISLKLIRFIWKPLLGCIVAMAISLLVISFIPNLLLMRFIISACCFGLTYVGVLMFFKEDLVAEILMYIFRRKQ